MEPIRAEVRDKMDRVIEVVRNDFATVRTGRANPALIENVEIAAYDGAPPLRLLELATITTSDARTLVIAPFDPSIISKIESGIAGSNLGFAPVVDEKIIRIVIPPLTEERRVEFVKLIGEKAESGKVMIRQARHDGMEKVKEAFEGSVDEISRGEDVIQKLTDEYTQKIEEMKKMKEEELMQL